MKLLEIHSYDLQILKLSAVECYPKECSGLLFGQNSSNGYFVDRVKPFETSIVRYKTSIDIEYDAYDNVEALTRFGSLIAPEWIIGDYHSHTVDGPTPSSTDVKYWREEEVFGLIISVWPGRRRGWCFRFQAYEWTNRLRRLQIKVTS